MQKNQVVAHCGADELPELVGGEVGGVHEVEAHPLRMTNLGAFDPQRAPTFTCGPEPPDVRCGFLIRSGQDMGTSQLWQWPKQQKRDQSDQDEGQDTAHDVQISG